MHVCVRVWMCVGCVWGSVYGCGLVKVGVWMNN